MTKTKFLVLEPNGLATSHVYNTRDAAAGACQDAVLEADADEGTAALYQVVECNSVKIVEVSPELTQYETTQARYKKLCKRLERCYSTFQQNSQYSVTVRPARPGETPGTYFQEKNGNLQIMGYSLEIPSDLALLQRQAWNKFTQSTRANLRDIYNQKKAAKIKK